MLSPRGARYAGAVGRYLGVQVSMGTIMTMFRYAGINICRYASIQVCRCAGMQLCRGAGMQVCKYTGMQVYRYAGMQGCRYAEVNEDLGTRVSSAFTHDQVCQ